MSVVLPAPVWPTIAIVSPGAIRNVTSRSTQFSLVISEPDVVKFDARAVLAGREAVDGGETTAGWVSSSLKTRSEAAIADCRMLYFSLRSWIGRKKRMSVLKKGHQHAQRQRALSDAKSAIGKQQRERRHRREIRPPDKTSHKR